MLKSIKNNLNKCKFADTGIDEMVRQIVAAGASRAGLKAKIAGGAQMFQGNSKRLLTAVHHGAIPMNPMRN